jgi:DNA polymerase-3 subunit epsilon
VLDRDLVCVDLETTGGNAAWHRIIEIGLVEVDRDGTVREWSTLVNPGTRIPPTIEQFTGITNAMVEDAPRFEDVQRELLARLGGRLFVAHNARFDYGFIRSELLRRDVRFRAPVLCTVRLSRRLFPEHPRHNLDAVIARHGLDCEARHRALGDARVLRDLLAVLERELEPARLAAAVEALLQAPALPPQLPEALADDLPELTEAIRVAGGRADVVIVTGGLGPTRDDMTRDGLAAAATFALALRFHCWMRMVRYRIPPETARNRRPTASAIPPYLNQPCQRNGA